MKDCYSVANGGGVFFLALPVITLTQNGNSIECRQKGIPMGASQLQIEEINKLLRAVDDRIESSMLDLEKLDEIKDADAYHALEVQIRALKDQQRMLSKRWSALTVGFLDTR